MLKKAVLLVMILLASCAPRPRQPELAPGELPPPDIAQKDAAQVVIYMRMTEGPSTPLEWTIRKIVVNGEDGNQMELPRSSLSITTSELRRGQKLLTIAEIEEGAYSGVTIFTRRVRVEGTVEEVPAEAMVHTVSGPFTPVAGDAHTVIILADLSGEAGSDGAFKPTFALAGGTADPRGKLVYAANSRSSNLSVIDKSLRRVVHNVFIGTKPYALAADQRRNRLYIADRTDGVIYEMDMNRQHLVRATQIEFTDEPVHIEAIPEEDLLVVVNYGNDTIHLIDAFNLRVDETVEVGDGPVDAVYSNSFRRAFVINRVFGTVSVLDMDTRPVEVDTTLEVELDPGGLALDDAMDWLYISNGGSTQLSVIKLETMGLEKSIRIGIGAGGLAFDPFGRRLYVAMVNSSEILCLDPYTGVVTFEIKLPARPADLLFDSDEKKLYAALPEANMVVVIDPLTRKITNWIETGYAPTSLALRL
jgi:YVTN family beta-propeller protein